MGDTLKELFTGIGVIDKPTLQALDRFRATYEVRDQNPLAFNTPMLGVSRAYWYPRDTDTLFDLFRVDKTDFIAKIKQCPRVDKKFNVTSNEMNILVMYLIYRLHDKSVISQVTQTMASQAIANLLKLLHYKFFCGKVAAQFPYNAKADVAQYTIDHLSNKSDIRLPETDTWKKMIYKHVAMCMTPGSIYTTTFHNFAPDQAILKSISDIHTRLCRKIVLVSEAYYENNAKGNRYTTSDLVKEDSEKGKVLQDLVATLDLCTSRVVATALNVNEFLDNNYIKLASKLAANTRPDMVSTALIAFSAMATQQVQDKTSYEVTQTKQRHILFTGYAKLIEEFIQKTYRRAAITGVDVKSNIAILQATRNMYSASRVNDIELLQIKDSFDHFVQTHTKYTRASTLVGLRLAIMIYLILLSLKYR